MSNFSFPAGIKNINPDPFTASIVITYNPKCIDIPDYLEKLAKDDAFLAFFWTDEKR